MTAAEIGQMGERVAVALWPSLRLVPSGSQSDRQGLDAWDGPLRVQIKADTSIVDRIFHEVFKRNRGWASFGLRAGPWRQSPSSADAYIFVGPSLAVRATVHQLAIAECGRPLAPLRPNGAPEETTLGFLVPIEQLLALGAEIKPHALWGPKVRA